MLSDGTISYPDRQTAINSLSQEFESAKGQVPWLNKRTLINGFLVSAGQPGITDEEFDRVEASSDPHLKDREAKINTMNSDFDNIPAIQRAYNSKRAWINGNLREIGAPLLTEAEMKRLGIVDARG